MQKITGRVRTMRKEMTSAETIVWEMVRNRRLGVKIVRQKPIVVDYYGRKVSFVADFFCSKVRLAIEIDGNVHDKTVEYDAVRSELLKQTGVKVIRFSNDEVFRNPESAKEKIKKELSGIVDSN